MPNNELLVLDPAKPPKEFNKPALLFAPPAKLAKLPRVPKFPNIEFGRPNEFNKLTLLPEPAFPPNKFNMLD